MIMFFPGIHTTILNIKKFFTNFFNTFHMYNLFINVKAHKHIANYPFGLMIGYRISSIFTLEQLNQHE